MRSLAKSVSVALAKTAAVETARGGPILAVLSTGCPYRAERRKRHLRQPANLIRVMPAEGC